MAKGQGPSEPAGRGERIDMQIDRTSKLQSGRIQLFLARVGRALRSGFMFSLFGIGSVLMAGVVIPFVALIGRHRSQRATDLTAQRLIQRCFALFVQIGVWIRLWDVEHSGTERLSDGSALIVANHPTLLDVVFIGAFLPQGDYVVKREAWSNPALGGIARIAGFISNDGAEELVDACSRRLLAGRSVLLFPEGSRSPEQGLRPFRRGAAHVALRTECRILPVSIDCQPPALKKGQPWWALPDDRMKFTLDVGEAIYAKDLVNGDVTPAVAARHVTASLRAYFESRQDYGVTGTS